IGRVDRGGAILIDPDLALGHQFGTERVLGDGLEGQAGPLGRRRRIARAALAGLAGDLRRPLLFRSETRVAIGARAGRHQHRSGHEQAWAAEALHFFGNVSQHAVREVDRCKVRRGSPSGALIVPNWRSKQPINRTSMTPVVKVRVA
ncbi:hypothetical protein NS115_24860, partial [Paenibacillus jamilae]